MSVMEDISGIDLDEAMAIDGEAIERLAAMMDAEEAEGQEEEERSVEEPGVSMEQLAAIVKQQCQEAIDYCEEDLAGMRMLMQEAYDGDNHPGDDELDDTRSRAISRDVHDTIHAILPSLMGIFCGSSEPVEYLPDGPEDEQYALQATDYVNDIVLHTDNDFFQIFYDAAHDALVKGLGVFKWWWEEETRVEGSFYTGLSEVDFNLLVSEPGVEIDEYEEREIITMPPPDPMNPMPPTPTPVKVIDCHVKRKVEIGGKLKLEAVPPEERLISRNARSVEDAQMYGHRRNMTVSELVSLGFNYDQVVGMGGASELETNSEAVERIENVAGSTIGDGGVPGDPSQRELEVVEMYLRVDIDGDGIAEQYRIFAGGSGFKILEWENGDLAVDLCAERPFAEICPDPVPHLATGKSTSAKVIDVQYVKTNLLRGALDSLSRSIFPREEVVESQVNIDDVMNPEIGAVIRTKQPGMIRDITTPFMGKECLPLLGYYDEIKANRSGVSDATMGLNPQTLQSSTQDAVDHAVSAAQSQVELIARHFGRGVQQMFRGVLRCLVKNQDQVRTVRLRGSWVGVDPSEWNAEMDATPVSALGRGTSKDKLAELGMIAAKQEQAMQAYGPNNPLCTMAQYRNTLAEMVKISGYYQPDKFFLPVEMGQLVEQNQQQMQQLQQENEQNKQVLVAMQSELMKRSEAAANKDQAAAFKSLADAFAKIVTGTHEASTAEIEINAAQDEANAYNLFRTGVTAGMEPQGQPQQPQQPQQGPV